MDKRLAHARELFKSKSQNSRSTSPISEEASEWEGLWRLGTVAFTRIAEDEEVTSEEPSGPMLAAPGLIGWMVYMPGLIQRLVMIRGH